MGFLELKANMITTLLIIGGSVWVSLSVLFVAGMALAAGKPLPAQPFKPEPATQPQVRPRWMIEHAPAHRETRRTTQTGAQLSTAFCAD